MSDKKSIIFFLCISLTICGYSQSFPSLSNNTDRFSVGISESNYLYVHGSFTKNLDLSLFHTTYIDYLKYQAVQFEAKYNLINKWSGFKIKGGLGYTQQYGTEYYKIWPFIQFHFVPVNWITIYNQSSLLNSTDYQLQYFNMCGIRVSFTDSVSGFISYGNNLLFRNYEVTTDFGIIFKSSRIVVKSGLQLPKHNPGFSFTRLYVSFAYVIKYI